MCAPVVHPTNAVEVPVDLSAENPPLLVTALRCTSSAPRAPPLFPGATTACTQWVTSAMPWLAAQSRTRCWAARTCWLSMMPGAMCGCLCPPSLAAPCPLGRAFSNSLEPCWHVHRKGSMPTKLTWDIWCRNQSASLLASHGMVTAVCYRSSCMHCHCLCLKSVQTTPSLHQKLSF